MEIEGLEGAFYVRPYFFYGGGTSSIFQGVWCLPFFRGGGPPPLHKPPLNVCLGVNIDVYLLIAHY